MRISAFARRIAALAILVSVITPAATRADTSGTAATTRARRPARGFVRVNQLGYPADAASKRAYVLSSVAAAGATFSVQGGGGEVYAAPIGRDLGRWSRAYPHVYALDLTDLDDPGTYRIVVSAPVGATSPPFRIGTGEDVYATALSNALRYYEVQRDGREFIPSALRTAPGHLHDANALTYRTPDVDSEGRFGGTLSPLARRIDASGGWWDAGDYLKFVHASSYTDAILLTGIRDFPDQMGVGDRQRLGLHRRGRVRHSLAPEDVERHAQHALLPGGHRLGKPARCGRPRHLAASAGRRQLPRLRPAVPLHPPPSGVPRRPAGIADQPEPRRPSLRGLCPVLPGVSHVGAEPRRRVPDLGGAHLRPRRHRARDGSSPRSRTASIPSPSGATTSNWARPSCTGRWRPAGCRRASRTRAPTTTSGAPPTGRTPTSPDPTTRRTP